MGGELVDICDVCRLPLEDAPGIVMLVDYETRLTVWMHEECEEMTRTGDNDEADTRGW